MFFLPTASFRLRSARGSFFRWSRCCFRRRGRGGSWSRRRSYVSRSWLRSRRRSYVSRTWLRSCRRSHMSRGWSPSLRRGNMSRTCWSLRSLSWGRGHMSRACWCLSRRRGHVSWTCWSLRSLPWGWGHMSRTCWSLSRWAGPLDQGLVLVAVPRMGWSRGVTTESFLPLSSLPMLMLFKKFLVITLTLSVGAPIGIRLLKMLIVIRMSPVPRQPARRIPSTGSLDISGRISVIRGPAVLGAEKVIQEAIQKPIAVVIDPRRTGPYPGCRHKDPGAEADTHSPEPEMAPTWRRPRLQPVRLPSAK